MKFYEIREMKKRKASSEEDEEGKFTRVEALGGSLET